MLSLLFPSKQGSGREKERNGTWKSREAEHWRILEMGDELWDRGNPFPICILETQPGRHLPLSVTIPDNNTFPTSGTKVPHFWCTQCTEVSAVWARFLSWLQLGTFKKVCGCVKEKSIVPLSPPGNCEAFQSFLIRTAKCSFLQKGDCWDVKTRQEINLNAESRVKRMGFIQP